MDKDFIAAVALAVLLLLGLVGSIAVSGDRAAIRAAECRTTALQKERPAAEIHLICGEYR